MMLRFSQITTKSGLSSQNMLRMMFCTSKEEYEAIRYKKTGVLDMRKLGYTPSKPLVFENGKSLIYRNKQKWYTVPLLYSHLNAMGLYFMILIRNNPCNNHPPIIIITATITTVYLTFPAALPLMFIAEAFILRRIYLKQIRYRPIVEQIYLLEGGELIEIVYANKITRKLKDLPFSQVFFVSTMKPPEPNENEEPMTGTLFPTAVDKLTNGSYAFFEYAWKKYYTNTESHIMIPMRYDYANQEVLIQVMKGRFIETGDS